MKRYVIKLSDGTFFADLPMRTLNEMEGFIYITKKIENAKTFSDTEIAEVFANAITCFDGQKAEVVVIEK